MIIGIINATLRDEATGAVLAERIQRNSITARGMERALRGALFADGAPTISVFAHNNVVTPAVYTISGHQADCDTISPFAVQTDAAQLSNAFNIVGRLQSPVVAREIVTVGLGPQGDTLHPSFAVRLSNPLTQQPGQVVDIKYTLVGRASNMTTASDAAGQQLGVTNATWDTFLSELIDANAETTDYTMSFVSAPDNMSVATSFAPQGHLSLNIGTKNGNVYTSSEMDVTADPTITLFDSEGTTMVSLDVTGGMGNSFSFNKSLVVSPGGTQLYLTDVGYSEDPVVTAQNTYAHAATSTRPFASTSDVWATSTYTVNYDVATTARLASPVMIKLSFVDGEFMLSTRRTWGFAGNEWADDVPYRFPSLPHQNALGAADTVYATTAAYTGEPVASFDDVSDGAFSARLPLAGDAFVGWAGQVDAICIPSASALTFVSNLGTTKFVVSAARFPQFTATTMTSKAVVRTPTGTRIFAACSTTGLWRLNETSSSTQPYACSAPFIVNVPYVQNKCYAVDGGHNDTIHAVFEGGLARSLNGGISWTVYNNSGSAGTQAFNPSALGDWSNVKMVIQGPVDVGSARSTVAVVTPTQIHWIELTPTSATITGSLTRNVDTAPFGGQSRSVYFPVVGSEYPTTQRWILSDTVGDLATVAYTLGTGPDTASAMPATYAAVKIPARLFFTTLLESGQTFGMLAHDSSSQSTVLLNSTFNVIASFDNTIGASSPIADGLRNARCNSYHHYVYASRPQHSYINPFANSDPNGGDGHALMWRDYRFTDDQWVRLNDGDGLAGLATGAPIDTTPLTLFSTGTSGILNDLPAGIALQFESIATTGEPNAVDGESITTMLSSSVVKDEYTSFAHVTSHSMYRAVPYKELTSAALVTGGLQGRALEFTDVPGWYSQRGTLSCIPTGQHIVRSELATFDVGQTISVSFRVSDIPSTGVFAVGVSVAGVSDDPSTPIAQLLPIRIVFTGDTYQVFRGEQAASSQLTLNNNDQFTISIDGTAGTFAVAVGGNQLSLSTANTIPAILENTRIAIAAFADANEHRYMYDAKIVNWPVAASNVSYHARALTQGSTDIMNDALAVTIESKLTPRTFVYRGVDESTTYTSDPRAVIGAVGTNQELKLLPKTGILLVHNVTNIASASFDAVVYKK